jgi:tetratricopeptide (TPR) repeat protein
MPSTRRAPSLPAIHQMYKISALRLYAVPAVGLILSCSQTAPVRASGADTLKQAGLIGEWAVECKLPVGVTNPHASFYIDENGRAFVVSGNDVNKLKGEVTEARAIATDRIGYKLAAQGITYEIVLEKRGERYRGLSSIGSDGKTYVRYGFMLNFNWGMQWLEKCPPNVSEDTQLKATMADAWAACRQSLDSERSISGCTKLLAIQPKNPFAHYYRGLTFSKSNQPEPALADYSKAIEFDPLFALAYNSRALILSRQGRFEEAFTDAERATALNLSEAAFIDTRARIYEGLDQREKAIADYRHALSLLPPNHREAQGIKDRIVQLGAAP